MKLNTTNLRVLYLDGYLRYIKMGEEEILRMMYTALRNQFWFTVPMNIRDEKIVQQASSFDIQYTAQYILDDINYEAEITITGSEDDIISFHFKGIAHSDFMRNRIGICIHHPVRECLGQPVTITQPNGDITGSQFPVLIDPYVTFRQLRKFSWETPHHVEALLEFEGDVFESEDQRNWSDGSFKTYSTPVEILYPVAVNKGDQVEQKIILSVFNPIPAHREPIAKTIPAEIRLPFPALGYARSCRPLAQQDIELLRQIIFNHYRVEIDFSPGWKEVLDQSSQEAVLLNTSVELVALFDDYIQEYDELKTKFTYQISSLIILQKDKPVAEQRLLDYILSTMKTEFPFIQTGTGTNGHFVELNRNRTIDPRVDFLTYSVTPQAHLSDDLVLIENLEAQQYPIRTIQSFSGKPIHISPVTLKSRDYPAWTVDPRQHTAFAANWTAISLKYLAGVEQITLFETIGDRGIINENGPSPVYDLLKRITAFGPKYIIKTTMDHPLEIESMILENGKGERMVLEIRF